LMREREAQAVFALYQTRFALHAEIRPGRGHCGAG
jgi:hypothetical protein